MKKIILVLMLLIVHCTLYIDNCNSQVWSPLGSGMNNGVGDLVVFNNQLIACGSFTTAGGVSANNIAKWNGIIWSPLGSGMNRSVAALTVYNNELIAGGTFDTAGGIRVNYITKWNGTIWSPLGSGMNSWVSALTVYNNELIAGGVFTTAGGVSANRIAKWNGTTWSPLGSGIVPFGVNSLIIYNNELIVGGQFGSGITKWNGTSWFSLGSGTNGWVWALTVFNNELIAGGQFTTAGGMSANNIAKWNGTTWSTLSSGMNNEVNVLYVFNNELIAGGIFTTAGGDSAKYIAKWNGATWSTLGRGMNGSVSGLTVFNNELIACGGFTTAGGVSANKIAKWGPGFTISGSVKYFDNNLPVTSGSVKAFRLDTYSGQIIILDSTGIQTNGSYILNNVPSGDLYIGAVPNSSPPADYVPTYYPSAIYYRDATVLNPTGNMTGIDIRAFRMSQATTSNSVNGKVNSSIPVSPLKDANVYAKSGSTFVGYKTTGSDGVYHINSVPTGMLKIIVDRIGYRSDSTTVTITRNNIDSVNFYLMKLFIGINPISNDVPDKYLLFQNYPNPFNPTTIIRFQIKEMSSPHAPGGDLTTLKVYDILGKEVATLVNENLKAGQYEVEFDGNSLPSGIYFYKLTCYGQEEFTGVKRMVLIK
jgi:hypothetical protein